MLAAGVSMAGEGGPAGIFTLSEKLQEKVVCPGGACGKTYSGSFQIKYDAAPYDADAISHLNSATTFTLQVGNFHFEDTIGSDPNFQDGDTKALLVPLIKVPSGSATPVKIKLSWKSARVKIQVKGLTPGATSPIAATQLGNTPGDIAPSAEMKFNFTDHTGGFGFLNNVPIPGTLTRKAKNVNGTDYQLDKIKVAGGVAF